MSSFQRFDPYARLMTTGAPLLKLRKLSRHLPNGKPILAEKARQ